MAEGRFEFDLDVLDLPVADGIVCVSGIVAEVEWYEDDSDDLHWDVTLLVDAKSGRVPIDVTDPLGRALFAKVHALLESPGWQGLLHTYVEEEAPARDPHREHRLGTVELLGRR